MNNSPNTIINGKAIASLILGILSIVCIIIAPFIGVVLGIIGLVLGLVGSNEIKRLNQSGRGLAVTGTISSGLGLLLTIFFFSINIAVF